MPTVQSAQDLTHHDEKSSPSLQHKADEEKKIEDKQNIVGNSTSLA